MAVERKRVNDQYRVVLRFIERTPRLIADLDRRQASAADKDRFFRQLQLNDFSEFACRGIPPQLTVLIGNISHPIFVCAGVYTLITPN